MNVFSFLFRSFVLIFFLLNSAHGTQTTASIWDALRREFKLNHQVSQSEVKREIQWLKMHPLYFQRLKKAEPYLYHILTEIKKHRMPGEIALIPVIESGYNPFAYSYVGAAGLWQLMPKTGSFLGLRQDWWFDGRRSILKSTDAALSYLIRLNHLFKNNWILAFAAYDSGEGTVARSIRKSRQNPARVNFWKLQLPQETKRYIPRLLALSEMINHASYYHLTLPYIPNKPYFQSVEIGSQIDLNQAAKLAELPYSELIRLNPGHNRWATPPYSPYRLIIPLKQANTFKKNLAQLPHDKRINLVRHQINARDNLSTIAQKYGTTVQILKQLNQLKTDKLVTGTYLFIPRKKLMPFVPNHEKNPNPLAGKPIDDLKAYKITHVVGKNDTFKRLEKRYRVTENQIRHWNMMGQCVPLHLNQVLTLYKNQHMALHLVQKGETLSKIAHQNHLTLREVLVLNPKIKAHEIKVGDKIFLA